MLNAIAGQTLYGTTNLTAAQLNAIAAQTLYGTANLTAAQIGAILGYAPGRASTGGASASGNGSDIGQSGAPTFLTYFSFAADGPTALCVAECAFFCAGGSETVQMYIDILDGVTGAVVSGSPNAMTAQNNILTSHSSSMLCTNLVPGRTYQARLRAYKGDGNYAVPYSQPTLACFNS